MKNRKYWQSFLAVSCAHHYGNSACSVSIVYTTVCVWCGRRCIGSVITNDATVRVLGTSFQVIGEDDFTEVSVESGLVSLAKNNSRNGMSLNLEKGEMGMITKNNQGIVKRKILDKNFLAWKSGVISFEGMKAIDVIKTINDVYNVTISMNEELFNCKLTAQFNQKSLDEVLQILSVTFDWNYEINDNKVIISGEGC